MKQTFQKDQVHERKIFISKLINLIIDYEWVKVL